MSTQTALPRSVERARKVRSLAIFILTNLISVLCMVWVLNGASLTRIWGEIQHMHWRWVALAVGANILAYLLQGWRWKLLLTPIARVPFMQPVEAVYVGLFANEVLPLRAGELIRCFLLSKSTKIPLSVTFASALIERIFDGIWLMACFAFCLRMGRLPGVLVKGGYILGIIIVIGGVILGYAMYAKRQSVDLWFQLPWPRWFKTLIEDLHLIGHSRYLYFSFIVSGAFILIQVLPIYSLVKATGLNLAWTASFVLMVVLRLSSVVPQAPGNLGSFQWVTAETLIRMFGLATAHAKRFSLILWAVITLPLILIGFIALAIQGVNMSHLHREATAAAQDRKESR